MVQILLSRRMALAGLALLPCLPVQAGGWRDAFAAALAANPAADTGITRLNLVVDGADLMLRYSRDVPALMKELAAIQARAPTVGPGYDPARGTNRFAQTLADGRAGLTEHWMGHDGILRMVSVTAPDARRAARVLDDVTRFRDGGGFGGPPLLASQLTAPQGRTP